MPRSTAAQTVLRIARSTDGMTFQDTGGVLARSAYAPDMALLQSGEVVAVFDQAGDGDKGATTLMAARSHDGGWTWSSPRRVYVRHGHRALRDVRHGDLLATPEGDLRLYFATTIGGTRGRNGQVLISSATTRDGREFTLDPATRVRVTQTDAHPMVAHHGGYSHLFAIHVGGSEPRGRGKPSVEHFLSRDGRRFAPLGRAERTPPDFLGSLVATPRDLRVYTSSKEGIVSFASSDGRTWRSEPGLRLDHGWYPAVVRLADGSYLMVYCAVMDAADAAAATVAEAPLVDLPEPDEGEWDELAGVDTAEVPNDSIADDGDDGWEEPTQSGAPADPDGLDVVEQTPEAGSSSAESSPERSSEVTVSAGDDGLVQSEPDEGSAPTTADAAVPHPAPDRMPLEEWAASADGFEGWDPAWSDGFAPPPDFVDKVDYLDWYAEYALPHPADNAYDAYALFIPGPNDVPGSKPEWPEFKDLFHDDAYTGPPAPWDPADHPDWNVTSPEVQSLLSQYREATKHTGYASPPTTDSSYEEDEATLAEILLPSLSGHRALSRATLADAWRLENGKVNPQRMLDAWETTLRDATHLSQGATLIEELVSVAIGQLTYKTARWALADGVFSDDELPAALDTMQRFDHSRKDPADALAGEHAFAMDITQHLFSPPTANGTPLFNAKRLDRIADWFEPERGVRERIHGMQPEDVFASIDAFDAYYRQLADMFRVGYPDVRAADVEAVTQRAVRATPLTELFLPSLSRYYQLKTRAEASRRATQLAYATNIYRARTGHWPATLAELPAEFGERMRTDPFSGGYFGYRVTDDGPVIYSLSENGVDDGGVHSPRWNDEITNEAGSDDYVFWPPQPDP